MSDNEKDLRQEDLEPTAERIEAALSVDVPDARREKAMFVAGVGAARRSRGWLGPYVPALAAVIMLLAIGIVARTAQPGQTLYPVRKVLGNVGLAPSTAGDIRGELDRADKLLVRAAANVTSDPALAQELVRGAWSALDRAEELAGELDSDRRGPFEREIEALEERAEQADEAAEETLEAREEAAEDAEGDSSGSGSGGGDSSGSGSGSGGDDDSSGPGSGDDSSGSGSGSDEDSSGSGSGGDSSGSGGDDSSGSGSGSGSGGDSSGSGSGGDDD